MDIQSNKIDVEVICWEEANQELFEGKNKENFKNEFIHDFVRI